MIVHPHLRSDGLGFLALFGFIIPMGVEATMRHLTHGVKIGGDPDWTGILGWVAAALYCWLVHALITWCERRLGYEEPGAGHKLGGVPIRYWSFLFLLMALMNLVGPWVEGHANMPSSPKLISP